MKSFKKYFTTGLLLLLPLLLTLLLTIWLFNILTTPLLLVTMAILKHFPIVNHWFALYPWLLTFLTKVLILILFFFLMILIGFLTNKVLKSTFYHWTTSLLSRIPLIKTFYNVSREIISSFLSSAEKKAYKYPVLIPFPNPWTSTIGFVTGNMLSLQNHIESAPQSEELVPVFVPNVPNLLSGYLVMVPLSSIKKIDITNEEALKFILSCGAINPKEPGAHLSP